MHSNACTAVKMIDTLAPRSLHWFQTELTKRLEKDQYLPDPGTRNQSLAVTSFQPSHFSGAVVGIGYKQVIIYTKNGAYNHRTVELIESISFKISRFFYL